MRYSTLLYLLVLLPGILVLSCKKSADDDMDIDSIPDTSFEIEVSGDQSNSFDITIPSGEPQTDFSIAGGYSGATNLLTMSFGQIPTGWRMSLTVVAEDLSTGTYQSDSSKGAVSSYANTGQPSFGYLGDDLSVVITKADLFASTSGSDVYYVSGNFSGTLENAQDGTSVNVNGSFSGVPVGAN